MFSQQNGCAYPLGLCKMGVRAPMVSIFMFMFFSFSREAVVALMVMMRVICYDLQVFLHIQVSCFRIEVSTGWVCIVYVLFLHCY